MVSGKGEDKVTSDIIPEWKNRVFLVELRKR